MNFLLAVFLLGIAGIDPSGAIVIIYALSLGLSKRKIFSFAIISFVGTLLIGIILSYFFGTSLEYFSTLLNNIPHIVYLCIECVVCFALLKWFFNRVFLKEKQEIKKKQRDNLIIKYIQKGVIPLGIIFCIFSLTDPSFFALIGLLHHSQNILQIVLANCIWVIISQFLLILSLIAILFNKHEKIIQYVKKKLKQNSKWKKIKSAFSVILSIIILIIDIIILADILHYLINGYCLLGKK